MRRTHYHFSENCYFDRNKTQNIFKQIETIQPESSSILNLYTLIILIYRRAFLKSEKQLQSYQVC
jgi:hypothetical protein